MIVNHVIKNRFYDSVMLMQIANEIKSAFKLDKVSIMMGTEPNKELMKETGVFRKETQAGPNDLIAAFVFDGEDRSSEAFELLMKKLDTREVKAERSGEAEIHSLQAALSALPEANLVFISLPGPFVGYEAQKAINAGMNVMIFSDNVSIEDELSLKRSALERGVMVMGPDCGTCIISGKALGFANVVPAGSVGIAGASGTGIQELSVLLADAGIGISHAIGTGGRDLSREVGGITMIQAINALAEDESTEYIVVISKPPHPESADKIIKLCEKTKKQCVICFIRNEAPKKDYKNIHFATDIEKAVNKIKSLISGKKIKPALFTQDTKSVKAQAKKCIKTLDGKQKYLRGLYSGGTLCEEALVVAAGLLGKIYSNTSVFPEYIIKNLQESKGHTFIDMGADEFTRGMPHPMIDYTLRKERLAQELADPETAVVLFDVVIGYGSHANPAGELVPLIEDCRTRANAAKRDFVLVAYICGTNSDPQNYELQKNALEKAGVVVMPSNVQAARFAAFVASRGKAAL